jgi:flagellin-specific chaperone FliS
MEYVSITKDLENCNQREIGEQKEYQSKKAEMGRKQRIWGEQLKMIARKKKGSSIIQAFFSLFQYIFQHLLFLSSG